MNNDYPIKLTNIENKYLTMIDKKPKIKSKIFSKNQKISHGKNGELIVDGKCLFGTLNDNLYFGNCDSNDNNNDDNKWIIDTNNKNVRNKNNKCLTSNDDDDIILKTCDNSISSQLWDIENSDIQSPSDYSYQNYRGKSVVLVDSDNPWYLNHDTTVQLQYDKSLYLKNNGCNDSKVEQFTNDTESDTSITQSHIILILLLIVGVLISYKIYKKYL